MADSKRYDVVICSHDGKVASVIGTNLSERQAETRVMTGVSRTNLDTVIDDAIASRCTAKLVYKRPSVEDQKRIWRILADAAEIKLSDPVIDVIAKKCPELVGRDVKNLLKLANLIATGRNKEINVEMIEYVRRFKSTPTVTTEPFKPMPADPALMTNRG